MTLSPIASQRVALVARHHWQTPFALAIDGVAQQGLASRSHIRNFDDCLAFVDDLVHWAPRECGDSRLVTWTAITCKAAR